MLGRASGRHLHALAHNRDPRQVEPRRRRRSIGSQHALGRSARTAGHGPDAVDAVRVGLVDRVTRRLRAAGRVGRTVVVRLRFDDFSRVTRSHTLPRPTDRTDAVLAVARGLLAGAAPLIRAQVLTLVGVSVANLADADAIQLILPFERRNRAGGGTALDTTLDDVRARFGAEALTRAVFLGRHDHLDVPLLPD
jgi:DNA polymerase-4